MGRSPCCDKNGLKKGPWTPEEDFKLTQYIQMHGPGNWRALPKNAGLQRCGKSCRLRWTNYLRPDIKRGRFSFEEEETIIQLHSVLGNKWSAIAARLPGRTDNEIKNYWNTHIRKRLLRMGIDPVTHAPRLDLLDLSSLLTLSTSHCNLSNLIRLQTLVNPEALSLAMTLLSSNNDNNQLLNPQLQSQGAPLIQPNQFDNINNVAMPTSSFHDQLFFQVSCNNLLPYTTTSTPSTSTDQALPTNAFCYGISDQKRAELSDNSSFDQSLNSTSSNTNTNNNNNSSHSFGFDSVLSSPLSSPLNPAFINLGNEDEIRENVGSNLFKFEIPESFDFDDFM